MDQVSQRAFGGRGGWITAAKESRQRMMGDTKNISVFGERISSVGINIVFYVRILMGNIRSSPSSMVSPSMNLHFSITENNCKQLIGSMDSTVSASHVGDQHPNHNVGKNTQLGWRWESQVRCQDWSDMETSLWIPKTGGVPARNPTVVSGAH